MKRDDLVLSLCHDGAVESGDNMAVKNRVRGVQSILRMVPDGSYVRRGDLLVRLDSTSLEEALAAERAELAKTEVAVIRSRRQLKAADVAVDEYGNGIYEEQRLQLQNGILEAQRELTKTEHSLQKVQIMYRMAFISRPHVTQMELAVEKAQSDLVSAKLKKEVLEEFTQAKVLMDLTSKRDIVAARLKSEESITRDRAAKIARLEEDLTNCEILAPRDGMVVYADVPTGATEQKIPIYEGAWVRQNQTLLHLANLAQMQVRVLVPQTERNRVRRGQRAYLRVLDQDLHGKVASVADRPEPAQPTDDDLPRFAVVITFDGRRERLKPGLTAEVEILVDHRKDALVIPLLCVVDGSDRSYVWVSGWRGVMRREIALGMATDALVEVIGGLDGGEKVILNPQQ
ncbi:MAG TPA: efflux RND transporter periplasmic adaptor subunit [Pirellulales bacterium]|nr:efflux RND transporter periplasmic adaptor subunit [Pirellulales bacterium]